MHFSPNIGERSSKCIAAPSKVSFSLTLGRAAAHAPEIKNIAGAQEIQHILKIAAFKVPLFLSSRVLSSSQHHVGLSSSELIILTVASRLILSRLRPRYAKVFKFHWL
jgi:hypothetical protein